MEARPARRRASGNQWPIANSSPPIAGPITLAAFDALSANAVRRFFGTSLPTTSKVAGTESGSQLVIISAPNAIAHGSRVASMIVNPTAIGAAETASATRGPIRCAIVPPMM